MSTERPSFNNILMNMALLVAQRSTCTRLQVGTVISSTDFRKVLAMGYNGNATGLPNTCDRTGEAGVGNCGCLHSEENAIINCDAPRTVEKIVFVTHLPCIMCAKRLLNLGNVQQVYYLNDYRIKDAASMLVTQGVEVHKYIFPSGDEPERMIRQGMT
jgi:dCMP deaminase